MKLEWNSYLIEIGGHCLSVKVAPDADMGGEFLAFCTEYDEFIRINGWLIDSIELIKGYKQCNI
jgi:hypothetical protein